MKKLHHLHDLMLEQIKDLYDSEQQQLHQLPKLMEKVSSGPLKKALQHHVDTTRTQASRLKEIMLDMNESALGESSQGMTGLLKQAQDLIERSETPEVRDAAIITALQHVNHYEIAGYGTASSYAETIEKADLAGKLHNILEEEKSMDQQLTKLAKTFVNVRAIPEMS